MALYNAKPGLGHTSEYQVSGAVATGVVVQRQQVTFTRVTKAITFWCPSVGLAQDPEISFTEAPLTNDILTIPVGVPIRVEIRTKHFGVPTGGAPIHFVAELTSIDANEIQFYTTTDNASLVTFS